MKKVDPKQSLPKLEEEVLKYWEENKIFEQSLAKDAPAGDFVFYEGPPTANGKPGLHHILARSFKDIIPRYKTMKGYRVQRKAGWDTHGLPVELQVEKKLGLKNKQDIENIVPGDKRASIIEFNKQCKESVWEYKDLWEKMTTRMGYWVDMEHPYVTYDNRYIESVWWQLSQIAKLRDEQGREMLYRGRKIVPYCYRCGTALSSHEVAQGYQTVKDNSVYVKFKVKPGQKIGDFEVKEGENVYLLAWTTTPWTLPGNVALAVNPKEVYSIKRGELDTFIELEYRPDFSGSINEKEESYTEMRDGVFTRVNLPKKKSSEIDAIFDERGFVVDSQKRTIVWSGSGLELVGLKYEPLFDIASEEEKSKAFKVVVGDFVTTDSGTGIVHIAPAFGEDDMNVAKENDLPILMTVDEAGKVSVDVPGKGVLVKKKNERNRYAVDDLIIEDLKERNLFFKEEVYEHEYPFCWRCDTPLIYYAKPSWFIRMSSLSEELVKNNESINWVPEHIRDGRFGEWLKGVKDWAISRDRFWGTPLPIWQCSGCDHTRVIGSIDELVKLSSKVLEDVHKPYIDDVTFACEKCDGTMTRTPEVLDVWFDSGAMPLAQFHYPHAATGENKQAIESGQYFPADYISEAIDQTRGWFYTLHAVATLLNKAGVVSSGKAYKNVICLAHILDAQGKKMSKSRGNVLDPFDLMSEFGADAVRWMLFTLNQPGIPKRFDVKGMRDVQNRVFRMLWNSYYFFVMYAEIDNWKSSEKPGVSENILDRWILSELQVLIREVDSKLDAYDVYTAGKEIEAFIDNLSNWYIRRSRKRFWKNENDGDKNAAYQTLYDVLVTLSQLMAPFTPFIAEEIYRNLTTLCRPELVSGPPLNTEMPKRVRHDNASESVHLSDFPSVDERLIDEKLNEDMSALREIVTLGLQKRAQAKIKVRQPLQRVLLPQAYVSVFEGVSAAQSTEWESILCDELNVRGVTLGAYEAVGLDTEITPELRLEGQAREIIRAIQELRKEAGYDVENRITLHIEGAEDILAVPELVDIIAHETLAEGGIHRGALAEADIHREVSVDDMKISLWIKR